MGFKDDLQEMITDMFENDFSDFTDISANIKDKPVKTYDANTASNTIVYGVNETLTVYIDEYTQDQVQGEILAGDVQMIIDLSKLSSNIITPSAKITADGKEYKIIAINPVPKINPVTYFLQCRGN